MPRLCVGALIRDGGRLLVLHRAPTCAVLPGTWDFVGGHVEAGETPAGALAREIFEETGWRLRRIGELVADWTWSVNGVERREMDYLVEVDGDLGAPVLSAEHDSYAWVDIHNVETVLRGQSVTDQKVREIVIAALVAHRR